MLHFFLHGKKYCNKSSLLFMMTAYVAYFQHGCIYALKKRNVILESRILIRNSYCFFVQKCNYKSIFWRSFTHFSDYFLLPSEYVTHNSCAPSRDTVLVSVLLYHAGWWFRIFEEVRTISIRHMEKYFRFTPDVWIRQRAVRADRSSYSTFRRYYEAFD